ncbi:glycoside hydrolase family 28 protein [Auriscalpium vulgare]|uniref:Glycoside hydrolase family 28 protein n=1 Tax=Auriscalpium vulgare TaxID=40419 RepID=A0ACB8RN95_9AGAM|nr:glycoside hydrolase family 28 protein [Auriscalpium vulgare]
MKSQLIVLVLACSVFAAEACVGSIYSLSDVASAVQCTTVNIHSFTVPAGQTFSLTLANGTSVNMFGDVTFGNQSWAGPLFQISGKHINFDGHGHIFNGNGPFYWDGLGTNGGIIKPHPMMKIKISGTFRNAKVLNSPAQVYSVSNPAPLLMTRLTVDNSFGNLPNAQSNGLPAGHNTDGFDVSTTDLVISNSQVMNQDDCLAINRGSNIVFTGNTCSGGHGISIGSIASDVGVKGITISDNTITNSDQALRIKMDATATNSSVSDITYFGNRGFGLRLFGILIDQSYPDTLSTPGSGVNLSGVTFGRPVTSLTVNPSADKIAVNCGLGACTGTWDWSGLNVHGGIAGPITNFTGIRGFRQKQ